MYQYPVPPPTYMPFDYKTPPMSPLPGHGYYSPRYTIHTTTASPRVSPKSSPRRASHEPSTYAYASPKTTPYYTTADYSSPGYYKSAHTTAHKSDYVSSSGRIRTKTTRRVYVSTDDNNKHRSSSSKKQRSPPPQYAYNVYADDDCYDYRRTPPPPYERYEWYSGADDHFYDQVPIYTEAASPSKQRPRRASHGTPRKESSHKIRHSTAKSPPKATEEHARRARIPVGYSLKNWDPTEEPIMLLGSVFDANSLGKWIYDWTVFHHGAATPMSEIAGDLWLLLIQIAGKMKRADECMPRIRKLQNRELMEDFLESGERLWTRFAKLLRSCEEYMWRVARRDSAGKKTVTMGKNAGCEFVESIFGRDRKLEETEKIMAGMRLWSVRFDANCEGILRYPSA